MIVIQLLWDLLMLIVRRNSSSTDKMLCFVDHCLSYISWLLIWDLCLMVAFIDRCLALHNIHVWTKVIWNGNTCEPGLWIDSAGPLSHLWLGKLLWIGLLIQFNEAYESIAEVKDVDGFWDWYITLALGRLRW